MGLAELLNRAARKIGTARAPKLPASVVTHDSLDTMAYRNLVDESARFRKVVQDAPKVVRAEKPTPVDPATATGAEIQQYRLDAHEFKLAELGADAYSAWGELAHDVYSAYHAYDEPEVIENVDPGVDLHKRLVSSLINDDDFRDVRSATRNDDTVSAVATMAALASLKGSLTDELADQARKAEEYRKAAEEAAEHSETLDGLRQRAAMLHGVGRPIPQQLKDQIKQTVSQRQTAQDAAAGAMPGPLDAAAVGAIAQAAAAGKEAADQMDDMPTMGGLGGDEFSYESPDEALSIAEQWANNPQLKLAAQMFGRLDRDMRFHRSKRVIGGQDEIVDIEFGDNLARVIPAELGLLADDDTELDFLARYVAGELLTFSTVGEEHGGRGPIVCVIDGSGSMGQSRTAWARAVAMCLLHICRRERRDFAAVEFGSPAQVCDWQFPKGEPISAKRMVEMASHFFGGGTSPIVGMRRAQHIIDDASAFSEADVVLIGDGDALFGPPDELIRNHLTEKGVRIFGIGVGGTFAYLNGWAEHVVSVSDFELTDPSGATISLATHIS